MASGSALDRAPGRADRTGVALEGAFGGEFEAAPGKCVLHARKAVTAEGIVLVEDADPGEVAILGEMLDPRLGLRAIAGANVDEVGEFEIAQEFGAAERPDEGNVARAGDWNRRHRGRRAHRADQREHLVVLDQPQRLHHRAIRIVAVVAADQLQPAAVDAALGVDLGEGRDDALPHALPECGGGTLERSGLAEQYRVLADADLVASCRQRRRCRQQRGGKRDACRCARSFHERARRMQEKSRPRYVRGAEQGANRCGESGP